MRVCQKRAENKVLLHTSYGTAVLLAASRMSADSSAAMSHDSVSKVQQSSFLNLPSP